MKKVLFCLFVLSILIAPLASASSKEKGDTSHPVQRRIYTYE